jgi:hypothetical protein
MPVEKLQTLLKKGDLPNCIDKLTPKIGLLGGRRFICQGVKGSVTFKELVGALRNHIYNINVLKTTQPDVSLSAEQRGRSIAQAGKMLAKLKQLDKNANQLLAKQNFFIKFLTVVRQFFGKALAPWQKILATEEKTILAFQSRQEKLLRSKVEALKAIMGQYVTENARVEITEAEWQQRCSATCELKPDNIQGEGFGLFEKAISYLCVGENEAFVFQFEGKLGRSDKKEFTSWFIFPVKGEATFWRKENFSSVHIVDLDVDLSKEELCELCQAYL